MIYTKIKSLVNSMSGSTLPVYYLGKFLALIFSFILIPFLTRYLDKDDFGMVGMLWLILPLSRRLINMGTDVAVSLKFFKLRQLQLANYVYHSFSVSVINFIILVLVIATIDVSFLSMSQYNMVIVLCIAIFQSSNSFGASLAKLDRKPYVYILLTNGPIILSSLFTIVIAANTSLGYAVFLYGSIIGHGIVFIVSIYFVVSKYSIHNYKPNWQVYKDILQVGLPVVPGTITVIILASGDRYVIEQYLGLTQVAIYTLGYRMAEFFLLTIIEPIQNSLMPKIMEYAHTDILKGIRYCEKVMFRVIIFVLLFLGISLWPQKWIINLIGGPKYSEAYDIYILILSGIIISSITNLVTILFNHFEKTSIGMGIGAIMATLNIGLNILFVPIWGIQGACIATLITFAIQQFVRIIILNRFLPENIKVGKIISAETLVLFFIGIFYALEFIDFMSLTFEYFTKMSISIIFVVAVYFRYTDFRNWLKTIL